MVNNLSENNFDAMPFGNSMLENIVIGRTKLPFFKKKKRFQVHLTQKRYFENETVLILRSMQFAQKMKFNIEKELKKKIAKKIYFMN